MNADRLSQVEEIYHAVLEVASEKRAAFLARACGNDDELFREVTSLLSFAEVSSSLIDKRPIDVAAEIFTQKQRSEIVGTRIKQYKIHSQIGAGGMGEVFLAE